MEINWHEMTKQVNILQETLKYSFIRRCYPLTWPEIAEYTSRYLRSEPRHKFDSYADFLTPCFDQIQEAGFKDVVDLAIHLMNQESIILTAQQCGMTLVDFNGVLYYLTYIMLPRNFYLRNLIQKGDHQTGEFCATLRKCGYPNSLDLLEKACTLAGRQALHIETGVPEAVILQLVHRADLSRVGCGPNMVNNYVNSGFETVEKLANSDVDDLTDKVIHYMASLGKVPKYGIDLPSHHAQVILAPKVFK